MTPLTALILDFDGVILESNELKTRAFERVFARFPEHTETMLAYHRAHVSDSRFAKFEYLARHLLRRPDDSAVVADLAAGFTAEMLQQIDACPFVPGAEPLLRGLKGRVPMFLASVTPQNELNLILERRRLTRYFERVYGCPPWTKPGAIADILQRRGGSEGVLFVGDSAGDQRAALSTGVEFLARNSGLPFDEPLPTMTPDLHGILNAIEERL